MIAEPLPPRRRRAAPSHPGPRPPDDAEYWADVARTVALAPPLTDARLDQIATLMGARRAARAPERPAPGSGP